MTASSQSWGPYTSAPRAPRYRVAWLVTVCLVGWALPALAGEKPKKVDPEELQARALFKDGQKAYDVGEFERALGLYTEAYKVKPLPGFLFNIAQCHRQLTNFKEAAFFFGRFIDNSKPEAANVELARELMADMQRQAEARASDVPHEVNLEPKATDRQTLPPPPPPPVAEVPLYQRGWFWGVVGGAVAVIAGGIVVGVVASQPRVAPYTPASTTLADIDARTSKP